MNQFAYSFIKESLQSGREVEFSYHGKRYSITNSDGYWNFCCDTDMNLIKQICPFEDKNSLLEYIQSSSIEGVLISAIFDDEQYDDSSICIL